MSYIDQLIQRNLDQLIQNNLDQQKMRAFPLLPESDSESEAQAPVRTIRIKKRVVAKQSRFTCDTCGSGHATSDLLRYHIEATHTHLGYKCPSCNFKNPRLSNVAQHAAAKHCKEWVTPFSKCGGKCQFCAKQCNSNPAYRQHSFNCQMATPHMSKEALQFRDIVNNLVKC